MNILKATYNNARFVLTVAVCLISSIIYGQQTISGNVYDAITGKPVNMASVADVTNTKGTFTDMNGLFKLKLPVNGKNVRISYFGYETAVINLDGHSLYYSVFLLPLKDLADNTTFTGFSLNDAKSFRASSKLFSFLRMKRTYSFNNGQNPYMLSLLIR